MGNMTKSWMQKKPFMAREARVRTDTPDTVTRLCFNENQFGCSPKATQAMLDAVAGIHIYPDYSTQYLKEKIGEKHGVSPYHIITGKHRFRVWLFVFCHCLHGHIICKYDSVKFKFVSKYSVNRCRNGGRQ